MTLADLRTRAAATEPDRSNPLVEVRTVRVPRLHPRARARLHDQALAAGLSTFRGVGVSSVTRLAAGAVPETETAESLELDARDGSAVYTWITLTEAGRAQAGA